MANKILKCAIWFLVLVNFWTFSRLTVDDAFITWRYGKNLVTAGVWNYNPTSFDPTQAYTNPIFATISILPALLGVNVVLFFKLFSMLLAIVFCVLIVRKRPEMNLWLAIFFAVPATMVHLFSGLETFLFVILLFALYLAVMEGSVKLALWVTLALFVTRPEGLLLVVLVPLVLGMQFGSRFRIDVRKVIKYGLVLGLPLAAYFGLNIWLFGQVLPNTFYVKAGQFYGSWHYLVWLLALTPLIPLAMLKLWKPVVLAIAFTMPVVWNYSTSSLMMNYATRFGYQTFAPLVLLAFYVVSLKENRAALSARWVKYFAPALAISMLFLLSLPEANQMIAYYPKVLASHGRFGTAVNALSKAGKVSAIAVGDSGVLPFNAGVPNLDTVKLGTHLGATVGITRELVEKYGVDLALIRDSRVVGDVIRPYLRRNGMVHICDLYTRADYYNEVWAKEAYPSLLSVCKKSLSTQSPEDWNSTVRALGTAPWAYWR